MFCILQWVQKGRDSNCCAVYVSDHPTWKEIELILAALLRRGGMVKAGPFHAKKKEREGEKNARKESLIIYSWHSNLVRKKGWKEYNLCFDYRTEQYCSIPSKRNSFLVNLVCTVIIPTGVMDPPPSLSTLLQCSVVQSCTLLNVLIG